ncbi:hypothetical protein L1887_38848 [Cichorium endivia]|nr:hypothetical protein L1887_38848 [Cichorium endivia]
MKSNGNPHQRVDERIGSGKPLSGAAIEAMDVKPHNMYKYEGNNETDDMLDFDATVDVTENSSVLDIDDDFLFNVKCRKNTLKSVGKKWKIFEHYLFKNFIEKYKNDPDVKLREPRAMYPFLKKDDRKLFVAQRLSKKWQEKSEDARNGNDRRRY